MYGDLAGAFVALTGGQGRLHSVIGMGALKQLLPYRNFSWRARRGLSGLKDLDYLPNHHPSPGGLS